MALPLPARIADHHEQHLSPDAPCRVDEALETATPPRGVAGAVAPGDSRGGAVVIPLSSLGSSGAGIQEQEPTGQLTRR
jgi:hypothetical protein